jgi:hypothetical protein
MQMTLRVTTNIHQIGARTSANGEDGSCAPFRRPSRLRIPEMPKQADCCTALPTQSVGSTILGAMVAVGLLSVHLGGYALLRLRIWGRTRGRPFLIRDR